MLHTLYGATLILLQYKFNLICISSGCKTRHKLKNRLNIICTTETIVTVAILKVEARSEAKKSKPEVKATIQG